MIHSLQDTSITPGLASIHCSYLNEYFSKFDELKSKSNWKEIVLLGELALADPKGQLSQKAKIHAQLATSLFYLGDYELCAEHANKCLLIAQYLEDTVHLVRSLYLLSAHKRAQANFCSDTDQQKALFVEARSYINKALSYFDQCDDECMRAKVLFNGGAAQADDPNGDYGVAIHWYREAMQIFKQNDQKDDYNRTAIRLANLALKMGNASGGKKILSELDEKIMSARTKVHFKTAFARLLIALEEYPKAGSTILDAIEQAARLEMKADIERLNELLESIDLFKQNYIQLLHLKC